MVNPLHVSRTFHVLRFTFHFSRFTFHVSRTVEPKIRFQNVSYYYGDRPALRDVTLDIPPNAITVVFGPAGGGKTTLLRLINRLNDEVEGTRMTGRVLLDGQDVYAPGVDVPRLRRRVGMVFLRCRCRCRGQSGRTSSTAPNWQGCGTGPGWRRFWSGVCGWRRFGMR
jgi:ABC-type multidrug transport system fused ATPase/permease subunit